MHKLKEFFDGECCRVIGAGGIGTFSGMSADKIFAAVCAFVTTLYVLVKLFKQLRDFNKPDKD